MQLAGTLKAAKMMVAAASAPLGTEWIQLTTAPSAGATAIDAGASTQLAAALASGQTAFSVAELHRYGLHQIQPNSVVNVNGVFYQPSSAWTSREAWSTAPGASSISAPLGSGWVPLLARPLSGTELTSPQLKAALAAGKQVFFRNEL